MFKKILSVVLASLLLLTIFPSMTISAEENETVALELNNTVNATFISTDDFIEYSFTPSESDYYALFSQSPDGGDPYADCYDSSYEWLNGDDDSNMYLGEFDFYLVVYLEKGQTYYFTVGSYEEDITYIVGIEKANTVESIKVLTPPTNTTYIEDFIYDAFYSIGTEGLELELTYTDGTTLTWSAEDDDYIPNTELYIDLEYVDDEGYYMVINAGKAQYTILLETIENPVESIEVKNYEPIQIYENSNGSYDEDLGYYIYYYSIPAYTEITINYKDGSSKDADIWDVVDGLHFEIYDEQEIDAWTVGQNPVTIEYCGAETTIYVEILDVPYKSVVVNSNPTTPIVFGDPFYGEMNNNDTYRFVVQDFSGLSFTLEYNDGEKVTYTSEDIDMDTMTIDGYVFELLESSTTGIGLAEAKILYKGFEIAFGVEIIESDIVDISVLELPDKTDFSYNYYADLTGMQVEVTYKDKSKKKVTLNSDTMSYGYADLMGYYYFATCVDVDGDTLYIIERGDSAEDAYFQFLLDGASFDFYELINYTEDYLEIDELEVSNVCENGDGMIADITYSDNSTDTLTLQTVYFENYIQFATGYALTENGILYYDIYRDSDPWDVYVLGVKASSVEMQEFVLGDVDGDHKVTILDATAIQRHLAQLEFISAERLQCSDTDKDGKLTILDATQIQRLLAKLIDKL